MKNNLLGSAFALTALLFLYAPVAEARQRERGLYPGRRRLLSGLVPGVFLTEGPPWCASAC